jgi:hypothetical protein
MPSRSPGPFGSSVTFLLALAMVGAAGAQSNDGPAPPPSVDIEVPYTHVPRADIEPTGQRVAAALEAATRFCAALPDASYRIDCLADRLSTVAASMPSTGPYAASRKAIADAGRKLGATARKYADASNPRNRYAAGDTRTGRPLTPVRPDAAAAANREATAIVAEAETVLLRSGATQPAAAAQIERIAAALASNKVLLRST